jgi:hypothetical protein
MRQLEHQRPRWQSLKAPALTIRIKTFAKWLTNFGLLEPIREVAIHAE